MILDQTPASIGDRIIARIIDMMVRVAYVIVALVFFTWVPSGGEKEAREKERQERIKARRNKRGMER